MRNKEEIKSAIEAGKAVLGIEFGSTRIKAVLIDEDKSPVASGSYDWENQLVDHIWTYSMDEITKGLQGCYAELVKDVEEKYGVKLKRFAALGVSAMMHGYLAFNEKDELLFHSVPGEIRSQKKLLKNCQNCFLITFRRDGVSHICIRQF